MPDLISEPIAPHGGTFDARAMAGGEPGLPSGFIWRGASYDVVELRSRWKHTEREGGRADGNVYLRRHYYRVRVSDGSLWTIYFVRQTPKTGSPKQRWFLYTVDRDEPAGATRPGERGGPPKLCPKIILEGTRLTLKTDIAFALNEHPRVVGPRKYRYHSPIVSAEWCGFTNVPWGRGLINFRPEEADRAMETYRTWVRLFELLRYYSWIVDRFHISTRAYQRREYGRDHDFGWLEERLAALGFRLVFCTRMPESFEQARAQRLAVSGKPSQYDDLDVFVREQAELRELVTESALPALDLDVSDNDVAAATDRVADWLENTGGLGIVDEASADEAR